MDIASWNVNSVRARLDAVTRWLDETGPDVVCLQEIKTLDDVFPREPFELRGYNFAIHGQKSYNGVAVLSKFPIEEALPRLPGDETDEQARYLETVISGKNGPVRVVSIYLPNGNPALQDGRETEKYQYKLAWMERLRVRVQELLTFEDAFVLAGDYNVIPGDNDVHDPALWATDALFLPQTRAIFNSIKWLGLTDAYEVADGRPHQYTYWDFQGGARAKNHGIRIDHLLLSPQAADRLQSVRIDDHVRDRKKPSDHVPIIGTFDL